MITLQTQKQMKKAEVADIFGVSLRTVWCVTKLEAETGLVIQEPIAKGPHWMLNGIDCAVHQNRFIHSDTCTLNTCKSI